MFPERVPTKARKFPLENKNIGLSGSVSCSHPMQTRRVIQYFALSEIKCDICDSSLRFRLLRPERQGVLVSVPILLQQQKLFYKIQKVLYVLFESKVPGNEKA